jgi:hypothetical protein
MPLDYHTPLNHHRALVLTRFMALPAFVAAMVFMLTGFMALPPFVAAMVFMLARFMPLVIFVPLAGLMSFMAVFVFAMIIITVIVLRKSWNGYADCKSKGRSKAVSNQFHLVHLRC